MDRQEAQAELDAKKCRMPAWVIERQFLEFTLESEFLGRCKAKGSDGCVVLYCPSLETFDPCKDDNGEIPLKRMWVDTYGGKHADIVLLVPWAPNSCPPDWFGVQHLINLVYWLSDNYPNGQPNDGEEQSPEFSLPKQFGEVAKRIRVLLCRLDTMIAGSGKLTIDYAFGIYFHPCSFCELNNFLKQACDPSKCNPAKLGHDEMINNFITKKVQLILGTSIGKPFSSVENGQFRYNFLLGFNKESAVPESISADISRVVLGHVRLVVEAFMGRCAPQIPTQYMMDHTTECGVDSIQAKRDYMSFNEFLSLVFLHIQRKGERLELIAPNKDQAERLRKAMSAAGFS